MSYLKQLNIVLVMTVALISSCKASPVNLPPDDWRSVVAVSGDPTKGGWSVVVDRYHPHFGGKSRDFRFLALWQFDPGRKAWINMMKEESKVISVSPASSRDTQANYPIPLVTFDEPAPVGLLWLDWEEDGYRADHLVVAGPILCNDLMIGKPPHGMITACVPYEDRAAATFVPDPKIHCRK